MRKKSLVTMMASLGLVAVVGVGSTLAYFTDQTDAVVNTFTVGPGYEEGDLTLLESVTSYNGATNKYEDADGANTWTTDKQTYDQILPGTVIHKDPTVTVEAGTIDSYVFVKELGVEEAKAKLNGADIHYTGQLTKLDGVDGVYYAKVAKNDTEDQHFTLFDTITVSGSSTAENLTANGDTMTFYAAIIQSSGFATEADAYAGLVGDLGNSWWVVE